MVSRVSSSRLAWLVLLTAVLPATAEDRPYSRIAFGSCMHQDKGQAIWAPLVASRPELFLFLGDNIYADTEDIGEMRKMYAQLAAQPGYQALQKACPILATWDDHDLGANDAGAEYPRKKEAQQAFLDFFGVPADSPRRTREGVYHAAVFGPPGQRVQVILLDTRYHRSALKKDLKRPKNLGQYIGTDDPKATVLGEAQWKWLAEQLRQPAELRLLCSSIQLVAEDHGFEKWMNFPRERQRLFDLLRETKAAGVVVLSGDRHLAELSVMDAGIGYPLYDLTSSGMNQANKKFRKLEANRHRMAIMDVGDNFGRVRVDWTREDPQVALEIHDADGEVTIRHKFPLNLLKPRGKLPPVGTSSNPDLATEARKHLNKPWTVEMTVAATGLARNKSRLFLNSDKDFRGERNLTVVVDLAAVADELKKEAIRDPQKHYLGKRIKVTGTVTLYDDRPQIQVERLTQIEVVDKQ